MSSSTRLIPSLILSSSRADLLKGPYQPVSTQADLLKGPYQLRGYSLVQSQRNT